MKLVRTMFSSQHGFRSAAVSTCMLNPHISFFPSPSLSWGDSSIGRGHRGISPASLGSQLWWTHIVSMWHVCRGRFVSQILWCPHLHEQGTWFHHQQRKCYIYHLLLKYYFLFLGKGTEVTICITGATSAPWDFSAGSEMESHSGNQVGCVYDWWPNADSRCCWQC